MIMRRKNESFSGKFAFKVSREAGLHKNKHELIKLMYDFANYKQIYKF